MDKNCLLLWSLIALIGYPGVISSFPQDNLTIFIFTVPPVVRDCFWQVLISHLHMSYVSLVQFSLFFTHCHKIKLEPRIKLNHNIYVNTSLYGKDDLMPQLHL